MTYELMKIDDVAAYTQIKVPTLRKYLAKNILPYSKIGGCLRFRREDVDAWIASRSFTPALTKAVKASSAGANTGLLIEG